MGRLGCKHGNQLGGYWNNPRDRESGSLGDSRKSQMQLGLAHLLEDTGNLKPPALLGCRQYKLNKCSLKEITISCYSAGFPSTSPCDDQNSLQQLKNETLEDTKIKRKKQLHSKYILKNSQQGCF